MPGLQQWIHALEEGRGVRVIKFVLAALAFVVIAALYDLRAYKNFNSAEAMDSAQLARNIAEGRGFTTDYVRPFSVALIVKHRDDRKPLMDNHPDLANPPVYPVVLAPLLKIAPVRSDLSRGPSRIFKPELVIALFNQLLFFTAALLVFKVAERLFDRPIAWISVAIFVGAELFWRFSVSGLSTLFLVNLFMAFVWCLIRLDQEQREETPNGRKVLGFAIAAGILLGLMALTRYSFAFLSLPAIAYVAMLLPQFRIKVGAAILIPFLIFLLPWVARNIVISGTPFGTAGYAFAAGTPPFPENTLERSLNPDPAFDKITINNLGRKLFANAAASIQSDLPKLGGNWAAVFFLAGLLVPFRNPTLSRIRIFLAMALGLFIFVQAIGRGSLGEGVELSGENLLVVFAPLLFILGAGFFFILLQQIETAAFGVREFVIGIFIFINCFPLGITLLQRNNPFAYPPYLPPLIQQVSHWMNRDELVMSDVPAAVAWYGNRQSAALTLTYDKDFFVFNDDIKTVNAVYLSPVTLNSPFMTDMLRPLVQKQKTWPLFAFECLTRGEVPSGFPLKKSRLDFLPEHFFLSDRERWKNAPGAN